MKRSKFEALVDKLRKQGVRTRPSNGGYVLYLPDGSIAVIHSTLSDRRGYKNLAAQIRRAGLEWPGED